MGIASLESQESQMVSLDDPNSTSINSYEIIDTLHGSLFFEHIQEIQQEAVSQSQECFLKSQEVDPMVKLLFSNAQEVQIN